ncbi:GNAT family N-acetyltransferase [Aquimarina algiphila]|uniref:GNAT family N-acetyltransferase n=1 Tax=Aquimarina algiphila TaxID=2047982 RepID=UPI00232CA5A5|nr:GNAT family N-acetyltransferase [Aquimarina algiphila]
MKVERLEWDSDFFEYEVGKVTISQNANFNFDLFLSLAQPFKLVYIFSEEDLNENSIVLVDQKVIFSKQLESHDNLSELNIKIKNFDPDSDSYSKLKKLALSSGIYSRFNTDINFRNNEFEKLYTKWINTSIAEKNTHEILIHQEHEEILGFVTFNKSQKTTSNIGLIAVDRKSRGMGVGTQLIEEVQHRVLHLGFDALEVVTQLQNDPATKLYRKCGFKIKEIIYIYHYWNI